MANYSINVGNEYVRSMGAVKQSVTVTAIDGENVTAVAKSGKEVKATFAEVKAWKLTHYAKKVVVKEKKRLNDRNLVDVAIDTILAHGCGMNAVDIHKAILAEGTYKFSPTAKTVPNTISSRLNSHINEAEQPKVKHIDNVGKGTKGMFYPIDYELPTATEVVAETATTEA